MGADKVAIAFASWTEAHKRHIEAARRLAEAERLGGQMGLLPPKTLIDEVAALKKEADRLLAVAEAEMKNAGKN